MCLLIPYVFRYGYHPITDGGLPHSEIPGSKRAYRSPRLIAVRCVLRRLLAPRHPPCALCNLTTSENATRFSSIMISTNCTSMLILSNTCVIQFSRNKNFWRQKISAWQRPTLPVPFGTSTIGAGGLNGRVRYGNGCVPSAIITRRVDFQLRDMLSQN